MNKYIGNWSQKKFCCPACGEYFESKQDPRRSRAMRLCSNKCRLIWLKKNKIKKECLICHKEYFVQKKNITSIFCSKKCKGAYMAKYFRGEKSILWKGGRINYKGYIAIYLPSHPNAMSGIYVFEHRLVIEKQIDRFLNSNESVHHINKIRNDNRIENLMAFKNEKSHKKFECNKSINLKEIIFDGRKLCLQK